MPRDAVSQLLAAYPIMHQALRQRDLATPAGRHLSTHQATALAHLDRTAAQTLGDLAHQMGVALPTMSLLVDRLVKAGMIRRDRDPADGRRVALRLTPAGVRVVTQRSLLDPGRVRALLSKLTPEERALGVEGVATLAKAARRRESRS